MAFFQRKSSSPKKLSPDESLQNSELPPSETSASPQTELQWERFSSLYRQIPGNTWNEKSGQNLRVVFESLQTTQIREKLYGAFPVQELENNKLQIEKEFEAMSNINRARMESLVELATKNLRLAVQESLYLFDVNPEENPDLSLEELTGYDKSGHPIKEIYSYRVFPQNTPHGIAARDEFLPPTLREGTFGMQKFTEITYPQFFHLSEQEAPVNQPIKALTTIGSLGGIGHKPDSDMDAQVIVDTEPHYQSSWNDADFLMALIQLIFRNVRKFIAEKVLSREDRKHLEEQASAVLRTRCAKGVSKEELQVIHAVFPGTFGQQRDELLWKKLKQLPAEEQIRIFWKQIPLILRELPDFYPHLETLTLFFPFLKKINSGELQADCFPFLNSLNSRSGLLRHLLQFYRRHVLGSDFASRLLKKLAAEQGPEVAGNPQKQQSFFLNHLKKSGYLSRALPPFLDLIIKHAGYSGTRHIPEMLEMLRQEFASNHPTADVSALLKKGREKSLVAEAYLQFRMNWSRLVEARKDVESQAVEANSEYPLHCKIQAVEAYLTRKYPDTEVHYFLNILRRMRKGLHTPFLVSPEGSLAYSLMLNDFLLNPATILGGLTPMPFELSPDFRVLASVGVFPDEDWSFTQTVPETAKTFGGDTEQRIPLRKMPDWGHIDIPRELFHSHVIPIFLRESEKVSHRNLPKALLNCWWVEMLFLLDDENEPLTGITRLLWNPDQRMFIRKNLNVPHVKEIRKMEEEFPHLARDPWWLKFTEMLTRFTDKTICQQIIFCFAQHIRLSDVIDFEARGKTIYVDKNAAWRTGAMVRFHRLFFTTPQKQEALMRFAQGRDDVANQTERLLKKLFLGSMHRVEQGLCELGQKQALKSLIGHLRHHGGPSFDVKQAARFLRPLLKEALQRVAIEDPRVLVKLRKKETLGSLEKLQARNIYLDHQRLIKITEQVVEKYGEFKLKTGTLENLILHSRVAVAGDVLENVIFKHHFERNFNRKPFQVALPISKSLSIPRSLIVLRYHPKSQNWLFLSMLSRNIGPTVGQTDSLEMFAAPIVQGMARCVFSGYVGYSSRNRTAFQKEAAKIRSKVSHNPLTHDDLRRLAQDIHDFFPSIQLLPRELLENTHYIREIYAVCNVNQFLVISLIVRDNLGECFVIDFDLSPIHLKAETVPIGEEFQAIEVFFDRLRSRKAREFFKQTLEQLKIPLSSEHPPHFGIWVNTRNFELQVAPKYHNIYLSGIAKTIWPSTGEYAPWQPHRTPLPKTLDGLGKAAIQQHHEDVAEKQRKRDLELRKVQRDSREYMSRREEEKAERERKLME